MKLKKSYKTTNKLTKTQSENNCTIICDYFFGEDIIQANSDWLIELQSSSVELSIVCANNIESQT